MRIRHRNTRKTRNKDRILNHIACAVALMYINDQWVELLE